MQEPRKTANQADAQPAASFAVRTDMLHARHACGDWQEVIRQGEAMLMEAPLTNQTWLALAEAYSRTEFHSLAVCAYQHLLGQRGLDADWYAKIYAGMVRAGQPELALAACRAAVRHYPDEDAACFALATQMARLKYPAEQVIAVLTRAVYLAPDQHNYRVSLALQHCRVGQWSCAYEALSDVPLPYLQSITCAFSAAMLARCCQFAGDQRRGARLAAVVRGLGVGQDQGGPA